MAKAATTTPAGNPLQMLLLADQLPSLQTLNFPACSAAFTISTRTVFIDAAAFTGRRRGPVPSVQAGLGWGIVIDTPGRVFKSTGEAELLTLHQYIG